MAQSMTIEKLTNLLDASPSKKVVLQCQNESCNSRNQEIVVKGIQRYSDGSQIVHFIDTHDNETHFQAEHLSKYLFKLQY